jgi:hypothetical protein
MAKVKNLGRQPRGFFDESYNHVIVAHGEEREFNMTENDYKKHQEILEAEGDMPPYELTGGAGGVTKPAPAKTSAKEPKDDHEDEVDKGAAGRRR